MYTSHGHHIDGTAMQDAPIYVARCGGPGLCPSCSREASLYIAAAPPHPESITAEETEGYAEVTVDETGSDSPLVAHAQTELALLNEDLEVTQWLLSCVKAFAAHSNSGCSAAVMIKILERLLSFENLSPLTDDPEEWFHHGDEMLDGKNGLWQNKRNGRMFSSDAGNTYWDVESPNNVMKSMPKDPDFTSRNVLFRL